MFSYPLVKDHKVFISWNGKHVVTLTGNKAQAFTDKIAGLDEAAAQLLMARSTGNFRRGNEKHRKSECDGFSTEHAQ
ncbi:MAG: hypothetical protein FWG47_08355 [Propionibacteriaceae bacterium]|nr:hypothetical protein [Propionibacteriaceae bacterium]